MKEHFTRRTVSVEAYCRKCGRMTWHRVSGGRKDACLECVSNLEARHRQNLELAKKQAPRQLELLMPINS